MKNKFILLFLIMVISIPWINGSATANWRKSKDHWPRLTYETADLPIIRAHYEAAQKGVEPYKTLWERIRKSAFTAPKLNIRDWGQQNVNASIIKARALLYVITGEKSHAAYVKDGLALMYVGEEIPKFGITTLTLRTKPYRNLKSSVMQSIHMAQSLAQHCQAYDMLKGTGYEFGNIERNIKTNLATLADRIYHISHWISSGARAADLLQQDVEEQNNFQLKMMSALGMAAICLSEHPDADKWMNRAMSKFWQVFTAQTTPNGGYGEGPFYFLYAGLNFMPFFRAYNLFMDGQGGTYDGFNVPNFLSDARVANVLDWNIKIRMPNGDRPGYDDGYYAPFMSGFFVMDPNFSNYATSHHPKTRLDVFAWDWMNTEKMTDGYDNHYFSAFANMDLTVDIFCAFDASVKPSPPSGSPTVFFPDAGNVVFRSGWDKDATYMLLLGEKGNMRIIGGTHEHPDAGSFVIFAHGELLALDSGYPGFPQHDLVNQAKNHSLILVDGQGPVGIDAELGDFFDTQRLDFASVTMSYGGANIVRNVAFIDNQYFVIVDQMAGDKTREYTWLLHGNAGGTLAHTMFKRTEKGAIWERPKARLEAYAISSQGNPIYEAAEDYHSLRFVPGKNPLPKHAVLQMKQTAERLNYLAVLTPLRQGAVSPVLSEIQANNASCLRIEHSNSAPLFCAVKSAPASMSFATNQSNYGEITTDADILIIELPVQSDLPTIIFAKNLTRLMAQNKQLLAANQKCNVVLVYDEKQKAYQGEVQGQDNSSLALRLVATNARVTGAKNFTFEAKTQTLQIDFDKPKPFRIEIGN